MKTNFRMEKKEGRGRSFEQFLLDRYSSLHKLPAEPDNRINNYAPVLLRVI